MRCPTVHDLHKFISDYAYPNIDITTERAGKTTHQTSVSRRELQLRHMVGNCSTGEAHNNSPESVATPRTAPECSQCACVCVCIYESAWRACMLSEQFVTLGSLSLLAIAAITAAAPARSMPRMSEVCHSSGSIGVSIRGARRLISEELQ